MSDVVGLANLSAFQRDVLWTLAEESGLKGVTIKHRSKITTAITLTTPSFTRISTIWSNSGWSRRPTPTGVRTPTA